MVPENDPDLDIFADAEWPQRQQHDAGGNVLQRALQRQADGQADGANGGNDRGRLDAELAEHHDDDEDQYGVADDPREEVAQRRVEAMDMAEAGVDRALGKAGDDIAEDQQDDGANGRERVRDDQSAELRKAGLHGEESVLRVDRHEGDPIGQCADNPRRAARVPIFLQQRNRKNGSSLATVGLPS